MVLNDFWRVPIDVLCAILSHLPIADYIRAGTVCRFWRQATAGKPHRRNPKSPLLMFPAIEEGSDDSNSFTFFSITDLTFSRLPLPQIRGKQIVGSSHGFIIAAGTTEILLLDPLTGAEVRLPPALAFSNFDIDNEFLNSAFMEKFVFLPSKSVAVAIYADTIPSFSFFDRMHYRFFARVGSGSWTVLHNKIDYHFCDMIYHKGEFYEVSHEGLVHSFNSEGGNLTVHEYGDPPFNADGQNTRLKHTFLMKYLVESLDEDHLLLVHRMFDWDTWKTYSFKVFRQDVVGLRWVEAGSLGEVAMFVGSNYSTCVFTRGLSGIRGNCVYFTGDWDRGKPNKDIGVFDFGDGSIQQLVTLQDVGCSSPPPFWIMPSSS